MAPMSATSDVHLAGTDAEWDDTSGRTPYVAGFTPEQDSDELKQNQ